VLSDARFVLMIVVYSGFWVLYFQNFGSVLWYLRDFVDRGPVSTAVTSWFAAVGLPVKFVFDAEHITVINAGMIILLQVVVSRIVRTRPALPTMVAGMVLGGLGFVCLAISQSPWILILGIAIFSIGEMTAHPKYYSFVGLIAPQDRKAVYMGYSFLYGILGSLLGSNIGAFLYERILKPVIGLPEAGERARLFWLIFAALDVVAVFGLIMFNRAFGQDTPETRRGATKVMTGVYAGILLLGVAFLVFAFSTQPPQYRTAVQSVIFLALGGGGLVMNLRRKPETV
jgi:POT family proton-dependent oligopeptide transporter